MVEPPAANADAALPRRMAAGDESALGALYDRWSPLVHSVVMRIVGDPDDAEELVEETFLQAGRQAESYQDARGGVATWLAEMARSRALDRVRLAGHRRAAAAEPLEAAEGVERVGPTPLDAAEVAETRRIVQAALERRPQAPSGRMFWDVSNNRWTFFAHHLPQARPGREYQLWLIRADDPRISAGTFRPDPTGHAVVQATYALPADALAAVAVTEEPAGGVPQPTGDVIILGVASAE